MYEDRIVLSRCERRVYAEMDTTSITTTTPPYQPPFSICPASPEVMACLGITIAALTLTTGWEVTIGLLASSDLKAAYTIEAVLFNF